MFADKNDLTSFNCATFVWSAFKYSANIDLDENGGNMVFPTNILKYFINTDFVIFDFLASAKVRKQGDSTKLRYNWTLELGLYINAQNYIEK